MVTYDPAVIRTFAQALYDRASTIILVHTAIGVVIGGVIGKIAFGNVGMTILAVIAGAIGYFLGSQRAFFLKLQAQTALCQVEIELNTRGSTSRSASESSEFHSASVSAAGAAIESTVTPSGPSGTCPNCKTIIPLASEECAKCKASFGVGSAWKVLPR